MPYSSLSLAVTDVVFVSGVNLLLLVFLVWWICLFSSMATTVLCCAVVNAVDMLILLGL